MYQSFTYLVGEKSLVYRDLAAAMQAAAFTGDEVKVSTNQTAVVEFQTIHEVIGDLLRNRAKSYKVVAIFCDACDSMSKVVKHPDMPVENVLKWIINNISMFDECRYSYNRKADTGKYVLGCDMSSISDGNPLCYHLEENI